MSPNTMSKDCIPNDVHPSGKADAGTQPVDRPFKLELVWRNVILMALLHILALYGINVAIFKAKWATIVFVHCIAILSSMGVQVSP